MTRVAVFSDIHGNLPALEAVMADARARGCDTIVNLGDSLSGPLWPAETADVLIREDWPTIAGNHERQLTDRPPARMGASDAFAYAALQDRHRAWIAAQPQVLALTPDILLCHGTPRSDLEHLLWSVDPAGIRAATDAEVEDRAGDFSAAILLCGHTHLPRIVTRRDGGIVANPGSVGLQAFDDDHPSAYTVENGDPLARYAVMEDGAVALIAVAYDHQAAAAKAAREGREDWAGALRTGRMSR
ncbi:MAG: metallophosphoesterase family protein [Sphingomonas sp.]